MSVVVTDVSVEQRVEVSKWEVGRLRPSRAFVSVCVFVFLNPWRNTGRLIPPCQDRASRARLAVLSHPGVRCVVTAPSNAPA